MGYNLERAYRYQLKHKGYTRGPWRVESGAIVGANGERIGGADRGEVRVSPPERDENVRLMAAAPELLKACKIALAALGNSFAEDRKRAQVKVLKAVNQGEGR